MALATRKKPTAPSKKRRALHHRSKSKHYVKPYLPYLPMLSVALMGLAINGIWPPQLASAAGYGHPATRIEVITGSEVALVTVIAISTAAFGLLLIRHGYYLRKALNRGEYFVVHHPWLDVAVTGIIVAGVLLTRTPH
jgi:hypothetical protein